MIPLSLDPFNVKLSLIYYKYISFVCCSLQVFPYGHGLFPTLTLVYYLPRWLLPYQNPASTTLLLSRVYHISSCKTNYLVVCRSKKWILFYQNWQNFLRYVILRLSRTKYFILNWLVGVTSTYKPFSLSLCTFHHVQPF